MSADVPYLTPQERRRQKAAEHRLPACPPPATAAPAPPEPIR